MFFSHKWPFKNRYATVLSLLRIVCISAGFQVLAHLLGILSCNRIKSGENQHCCKGDERDEHFDVHKHVNPGLEDRLVDVIANVGQETTDKEG